MTAKTRYEAGRDELLAQIHRQLLADERVIAAWLTGSLGQGKADEMSDIDLTAVVSEQSAGVLCTRNGTVGAGAPADRLALLSASARPTIIHENHHNAPNSGTFTVVVYEESGVSVDWTLIPATGVCRPSDTVLLFERQSIPLCRAPLLPDEIERSRRIAERAAFFWMMVPQVIKSLYRDDFVHFHVLAHMLEQTRDELTELIREQPHRYRKGSQLPLGQTRQQGKAMILDLCHEMTGLFDELEGGSDIEGVHGDPMLIIDRLLQSIDEGSGPGKADNTL